MNRAILALTFALSVAVSAQDAVKKELAPLQGSWVVTSASGRGVPAGLHAGFVVTGDKYQGTSNGKPDEAGTIKLDPTTKPASIDLVITEGKHAGKTQLGRVEVSGNKLTVGFAEPGETVRPAGMSGETLTLTKLTPLGKELEGAWEGTITNSNGDALRLLVKLSNGPDGFGTGTLVSVDQGGREAPIAAVPVAGSYVEIIIPVIRATFECELKDGVLTGTFSQGPNVTPIVFKRPG